MSEHDAIRRAGDRPITVNSLVADLRELGIRPGMMLLVHSSLSSIGWVCGGAVAVVEALQTVLGDDGTLVMPTHTADCSDPRHWENPPVPESWWATIRETMPAFDPLLTRTRGMGQIVETFRIHPAVVRSNHPQYSFAAGGRYAESITAGQSLEFGMGEASPLGHVYDLGGWVLLLGVGHDSNTSLHLAESRAEFAAKTTIETGAALRVNGTHRWQKFRELAYDESDFRELGQDFESMTDLVKRGLVGKTIARLMPQRELVDFAVGWINANRQ